MSGGSPDNSALVSSLVQAWYPRITRSTVTPGCDARNSPITCPSPASGPLTGAGQRYAQMRMCAGDTGGSSGRSLGEGVREGGIVRGGRKPARTTEKAPKRRPEHTTAARILVPHRNRNPASPRGATPSDRTVLWTPGNKAMRYGACLRTAGMRRGRSRTCRRWRGTPGNRARCSGTFRLCGSGRYTCSCPALRRIWRTRGIA